MCGRSTVDRGIYRHKQAKETKNKQKKVKINKRSAAQMVVWHATSAVWQRMKATGNKRSKLPHDASEYIKIPT